MVMRTHKNKSLCYLVDVLVLLALIVAYPFVICQFVGVPSLTMLYGGISALLIMIIANRKIVSPPRFVTECMAIQVVYFILSLFLHRDMGYIEPLSFAIIAYLFIVALQSAGGLKKFFVKYNFIICIMSVCGIIAFVGVFFNVLEPYFSFENRDGRQAWCFGLTCTNVFYGNIIRAAGYFDEPGSLAQWGVFCLLINKLFIRSRRIEFTLIIGLISTFSLAYFIQLFFYLLLFYKGRKKSLLSISLLLIIIGWYVYNTRGSDRDLYVMTYERMESVFEGESNRTGKSLENAKKIFAEEPLFGAGPTKMKTAFASDNPYESLASDGIFGTVFMYLPLIFVLMLKGGKDNVFAVIILLVGYMQRPFHFQVIHFFMIYSFLTLCCYEKRKRAQSISCYN